MGEGDEVSIETQEEAIRVGRSTASRHRGPLQRYINERIDSILYMVGGTADAARRKRDGEDTPEEEQREFEQERQEARNPDHPGEQMSGTL